jgi:hypothetical protein
MGLLRSINSIRHYHLADIATLNSGYSYRDGFIASKEGPLVIQLKDIEPDGTIMTDGLTRGMSGSAKDSHYVQAGDLVFRSRGNKFTAGIVPEMPERLLLAAPLIRISVTNASVMPEYLEWFINGKKGQAYLNGSAEGSTVKMLNAQVLKAMVIPVPPLDRQRQACELLALHKKEIELNARITAKRARLVELIIEEYTTQKGDHT